MKNEVQFYGFLLKRCGGVGFVDFLGPLSVLSNFFHGFFFQMLARQLPDTLRAGPVPLSVAGWVRFSEKKRLRLILLLLQNNT